MKQQSILERFIKELEVPYTKNYIYKIYEEFPYKYSLYGISQLLYHYNIENEALRLYDKNEIKELATPFLAEFSNDFVIVKYISSEKVTYDWYGENITISYNDFISQWSGVVLLAYTNKSSIEPQFQIHKKIEIIETLKTYTLVVASIFCFMFLFYSTNNNFINLIPISINSIGIFITYLLLLKQQNIQNYAADKICNVFKKSSCTDLLQTPASKLWGIFGWSEIGFSFFITNFFFLVTYSNRISLIPLITLVALPYTIWSIWYQKFKANIWCPLCLMVQLTIWLLFFSFVFIGSYSSISIDFYAILLYSLVYLIILLTTNKVSIKMTNSNQVIKLKYDFNSFKSQNKIFENLLLEQNEFEIKNISSIYFGNINSNFTITVFSNPYCDPCSKMHKRLNILIDSNCRIQYVFNYFTKDLSIINKYLIAAYIKYGNQKAWQIFSEWYESGKSKNEDFFSKMELDINNNDVEFEFQNHNRWKEKYKLSATPTILINGRLLPNSYKIEDLFYLLEHNIQDTNK